MSATEVLTACLVLITAYYAFQNQRMVREMSKARKVTVLPKLALSWSMVGPVNPVPSITNVGPGPALDIEIDLTYVPIDGSDENPILVRWESSLMVSGEVNEFLTPEGHSGSMMQTQELADRFAKVTMSGRCTDALGTHHEITDILPDIAAWQKMSAASRRRWQSPDAEKRFAKAFAEKFEPILKALKP
jgi:hypothetical protein